MKLGGRTDYLIKISSNKNVDIKFSAHDAVLE